ncbi:MAG: glycogen synthase GlgA [Candidatus Eisenbacteria bacterium]|jgi:starch synthase|nr:glycogen synthase GlgA [Candidatus Eisenbacteria bacterium]
MSQPASDRPEGPALKVLHIASESVPYAKTGGLADVVGALPIAQARMGLDVRVVLPGYGSVNRQGLEKLPIALGVPMGPREEWGAVLRRVDQDVAVFFLEHDHFYNRPWLYGPPGDAFGDNLERFVFLSRGALQLCHATQWFPDIVHAHDWHAAIAPVYLNSVERTTPLGRAASVLTIHNIDFQGNFPAEQMPYTGLGWEHFTFLEMEYHGKVSLLKGGIAHSTVLTTVSPTYAWEIQSSPLGQGMEGMMRERHDFLVGILNGIDYAIWNPETDPYIPVRYSVETRSSRAACKEALQRRLGLEPHPGTPLLGMVTRLSWQKGIDVLLEALPRILDLDVQVVILGAGDPALEKEVSALGERWPGRAASVAGYSEELAHQIYAGSDFFLMPSRFEPGGLGQLYALRYGSLPIVRATGGLVDTVQCYEEKTGEGTGFAFNDLTPGALADAAGWATWAFHNRPSHVDGMRKAAMLTRFSWDDSAQRYFEVYRWALRLRRG